MKRNRFVFVAVGAVLLCATYAWAKLRPGPPIMVSNLNYMNNIMKGFALSDFTVVADNAKALKANGTALKGVKVEDLNAGIPKEKQADFVKYATAFETEAGNLEAAARSGSPDKALEAYKNMIATGCYACHSKLRD